MAKFRKNHSSNSSKSPGRKGGASSKSTLFRSIFFFVGICIMIYILSNVKSDTWEFSAPKNDAVNNVEISDNEGMDIEQNYFPESSTGEVIDHTYYTLSYSEQHEQAEWVAYKLTKENLRKPRVKRAKKFRQDNRVSNLSAKHNDYSHSGYTRGHLAPAGDMAFNEKAMQESFFMSNMSPQKKAFNGGIWRELEEHVRDWAFDNEELYIVTGPILKGIEHNKQIGFNKITVPDQFYKVILDLKAPEQKAIAFLMPNEKSEAKISEYAVSIDEIERLTGLDFFADFLPEELEAKLESEYDIRQWEFDYRKYTKRVSKWNNY